MPNYAELEANIKSMINKLQGLCNQKGLTNTANEELVVTTVFLYKFLSDKFISNLNSYVKKLNDRNKSITLDVVKNDANFMAGFYDSYPQDVSFKYEDTIDYLASFSQRDDFYKMFDETLIRISSYKKNESFNINGADGSKKPLFTAISDTVTSGKNAFIQDIFSYITRDKFDFSKTFDENYDFFSTIFEYLISNYNKDSGDYAEYFTPQALSNAIGKILVHMSPIKDTIYDIYDPSAGSGSLVLHLANELGEGKFGNKARVYTQDVSQKSTRFLRINMLLNGLKESLDNIVEGDTLLSPAHYEKKNDATSGLKHFDFITSNPPFGTDFSKTRNKIEENWNKTTRFFAGVPKIPASAGKIDENGNEVKVKMDIYLLFIQHILYSLKDNGKAAIVVPTGFLTKQYRSKSKNGKLGKLSIEGAIREKIVEKKWLRGVISMPSNIFANTGTNVSVFFIDKSKENDDVVLIDASKMGEQIKIGKNKRTVLTDDELKKIIDYFINNKPEDDFSVIVSNKKIANRNYSFAAGQFFDVKIEYSKLSTDEFNCKMDCYKTKLLKLFDESSECEGEIIRRLEEIKYGV